MNDDENDFWIYRGKGRTNVQPQGTPRPIPAIDRHRIHDPAFYQASDELVDAVNVALHLDKPLLLTGEAGQERLNLPSVSPGSWVTRF